MKPVTWEGATASEVLGTATYTVSRQHITDGRRGRCSTCPAALALAASGLVDVSADALAAKATLPDGRRVWAWMPERMARFIRAFDAGQEVAPVRFELTWHTGAAAGGAR